MYMLKGKNDQTRGFGRKALTSASSGGLLWHLCQGHCTSVEVKLSFSASPFSLMAGSSAIAAVIVTAAAHVGGAVADLSERRRGAFVVSKLNQVLQ